MLTDLKCQKKKHTHMEKRHYKNKDLYMNHGGKMESLNINVIHI